MIEFGVDPASLGALADLLDGIGSDAQNGKKYVDENTKLSGGEGWLNKLSGAHTAALGQIRTWLNSIDEPVTAQSATAVRTAVNYYNRTDHGSAAALDRTLKEYDATVELVGHEQKPPPFGLGPKANFAPVVEPGDSYKQVTDYDDQYAYRPAWYDMLSAGAAPRHAIIGVSEILTSIGWMDGRWDPYDWMLKPVIGDWAGLRASADVFSNVSAALGSMNQNLRDSRLQIPNAWVGNAADGCSVHIANLATAIIGGGTPLDGLAEIYIAAADGARTYADLMSSLLDTMVECAGVIIVAVAAGGATVETVIGPIIGGGVAAYEAYLFVKAVQKVAELYSTYDDMMNGWKVAVDGFGDLNVSSFYLPPLPRTDDPAGSPMPKLPES